MHRMSRRSVALIATAATLGAGSITTAAQASNAISAPSGVAAAPQTRLLGVLDPVLTLIGAGSTPTQVQGAVAGLAPAEIGSLLDAADPTQFDALLGGLDTTQITGALATLAPADLTSILTAADPTQLPGLVGALAPEQLAGVLGLLEPAQLLAVVGALTPAQVSALLGPLLGVPAGAAGAAIGATAPRPPAPRPAQARPAQPGFTAYAASVRTIKVAKTRRSAKLTISCPAAAPKGCLVTLKGSVAGKRAFAGKTIVIKRNASKTLSVKLTTVVTRRLKKKGGTLKVSALTALSSLPATTKTVKIARRR